MNEPISIFEFSKKARDTGLSLDTVLHMIDQKSIQRIRSHLGKRALLVKAGIGTIDPDVELAFMVANYMGWRDDAESTREVAEGGT